MLTEVISKQTSSLQVLNPSRNLFKSVSAEKLLTIIAECGVCSTLKEILLSQANFDSIESVRKLADIVATAPVLKKCDIR